MDWKTLIPIFIEAAKAAINEVVDGAKMGEHAISLVRVTYVAVSEAYDDIVVDPANSYTDEALDAFMGLCEKKAAEGNWALYELPA